MTIKMGVPEIPPVKFDSQFPPAVHPEVRGGVIYYPLTNRKDEDEEEELERFLRRVQKRQLLAAERARLLTELKPSVLEEKEDNEEKRMQTSTKKRYLVDPETGVISIDEENGEYNYRDALLISSSIKAKRGEYEQALNLINALKEWTKGTENKQEEKPKKEFYVTDEGIIVHDPQHGELTLSEARAVSESKKRSLSTQKEDNITPEKLELLKRDIRDEVNRTLEDAINQIRQHLTPKEQEALFTIEEDGKVQVNPRARLGINEFLLYQLVQNMTKKDDKLLPYKDSEGNVLPLPAWLELDKHRREEKRKDERHEAIVSLIQEGRKELPNILAALKNLATSSETAQAMAQGGWVETTPVKSAPCPNCHTGLNYTQVPSIVRCPQCGSLAVLGSPSEQKELLDQLTAHLTKETKPAETQETQKEEPNVQ